MPNGFGRGRGSGRGFGRGMGFGFRGASPPWPYVGIGRGGLPRCGYFFNSAGTQLANQPAPYGLYSEAPYIPADDRYSPQMSKEQELSHLRDQAQMIKDQLDDIDSKMHGLEAED